MERIYFDKQIFSHLYKGEKLVYQNFLKDLIESKDVFLFCYSQGHLLDLKNDKTEIKYKELDFIETLVGDNYLSYHAIDKKTSCYLARPNEAFKDIDIDEEPFSLSTFFGDMDLSYATEEQAEQLKNAIDILKNQKLDFGFLQNQEIPKELSETIGKFLPVGLNPMSIMEWSEHFKSMLKTLEDDKTAYKGLRNAIDKNINNGKFTVDYDEIDFNDELKNSVLQKTFIEYVNNNLNPNGDKIITDYDFYIQAYFTLDLLGISKEKNARFKNVMNDGYHSYYGAFCNFVVSDDQGFLKKTRALYKLLGIETKVYHIDEFISYFTLLKNSLETESSTFFKLLRNDIKNGLVLENKNSLKYNRQTTIIKPFHSYLNYFNRIESINEDNQSFILLRRKTKNYSYFSFYREYEGIVNNAFKLFGYDKYLKGEFIWETEIKEINNSNWDGRFWDFDNLTILIEINKGINEICLLISTTNNQEKSPNS